MDENTKNLNINDVLNLITTANKSLEHDVFIPSINKDIHLKPLTSNHTKNIAKSAIEGPFEENQFTLMIYNILKDIIDPQINLNQLNIYDKTILLLELRNKNIKNFIEVTVVSEKEYADSDGKMNKKNQTVKVNIQTLLNKIKKWKVSFENEIIEADGYNLVLNYPSIEEEYQFANNLYKTRISNINEKDEKALRALFNPMYVNTLSSYIKQIKIGEQVIDTSNRKITERLDITETLSAKAGHKLIEKIDSVFMKQLNKLTLVEETIDDEKYVGEIRLSPAMFLA
jgi:hypothetical protein